MENNKIENLSLEQLLDLLIYNYSYINYFKDSSFCIIPFYYFKYNFILNNEKCFYSFISLKNKILSIDTRYSFLFNNDQIRSPETLDKKQYLLLEKLYKENFNDYYLQIAYFLYNFSNNFEPSLLKLLDKLILENPLNPYLHLYKSRLLASSLYKINKDEKLLLLAEKNIFLSIKIFKNLNMEVPSICYSWLWNIYHQSCSYYKAILNFDKSISINKSNGYIIVEPFIWKSFSQNKLWLYEKSLSILKDIESDDSIIIKDNDKRDFRFYKIMCDNYYNLWNYDFFYKYLVITIKKFLDISSFDFNNNLYLNIYNIKLDLKWIKWNSYKSFLDYNNDNINTDIDYIIFWIAFLYKEKLIWENIRFKNSRWIEKLCYNYLNLIYDNK